MKPSGIGGQAVLEGIMMKNGDNYAVAIRKPDKEIIVKQDVDHSYKKHEKLRKIPFVRGIFNFINSLVLGMNTLTYSAEFYEEDEKPSKLDKLLERYLGGFGEKFLMGVTVACSIVLAVAIFMVAPFLLIRLLSRVVVSEILLTLLEGILRVGILLGYIALIARMEDIQRVFMYHGAEHKCINCIEHGMELNVENVMKSSREHKRCGTSFLLIVMIVSIVLLICSMGVYQSYISIAIALMLMGMLKDLLKDKDYKKIFLSGILCVVVLLVAVLVYMKLCHIINPNMDNETYGGVGNMGKIPIQDMPVLFARCYKRFLEFFIWKPFDFMPEMSHSMNTVIFIFMVCLGIYLIYMKRIYKDKLKLVFLCFCMGLIPFATAFIYFMGPEVPYSMLMLYPYVFVYVFVIAMIEICIERWDKDKTNLPKKNTLLRMSAVGTVCAVVIIASYSNYLVTNQAYMRMELAKDRVVEFFERVISRVELEEGFTYGDKVSFVGEFYYVDNPSIVEITDNGHMGTEALRSFSGVALENGLLTSGVRNNFIRYFLGFEMYDISDNEFNDIKETDTFKNMPLYPAQGCIQKINDIWIVKLCE